MQMKDAMWLAHLLRGAGPLRRLRGWHRVVQLFFDFNRQASHSFDIGFNGCRYRGNANNYVDRMAFFYDVYEKDILRHLTGLLEARTSEPIVLDVGANVGHHSLYFASEGASVHAFEPNPALQPAIREKIAMNGLEHVITVHAVGLGDEDGILPFTLPPEDNQGMGSFATRDDSDGGRTENLQVVRGDDYLAAHGIDRCDLIKIDVEGFEKAVLRGLGATIARHAPLIFMEVSGDRAEKQTTFDMMRELYPAPPAAWTIVKQKSLFLNVYAIERVGEIADGRAMNVIFAPA